MFKQEKNCQVEELIYIVKTKLDFSKIFTYENIFWKII